MSIAEQTADVAYSILAESMVPAGVSRLVCTDQLWRRRGRDDCLVRVVSVHDGCAELSADMDPQHLGPCRDLVTLTELADHYQFVGQVRR